MTATFALERTVVINATRATVFRYFTDSGRFAAWWGEGSRIEGKPGGAVVIRYPNGVTASGQVLEIVDGRLVVFTYGYDDPAKPIPPGGSRVTIRLLTKRTRRTRLHLPQSAATPPPATSTLRGWLLLHCWRTSPTVAAPRPPPPARPRLVDRLFSL